MAPPLDMELGSLFLLGTCRLPEVARFLWLLFSVQDRNTRNENDFVLCAALSVQREEGESER